jgi:hypothetical protein
VLILTIGLANLPFLAGIALLPFQLALLEWYRKAELCCDRAGLLGVQDAARRDRPSSRWPAARGRARVGADDPLDLDAFLAQAAEYELGGTPGTRCSRPQHARCATTRSTPCARRAAAVGAAAPTTASSRRLPAPRREPRPARRDYSEAADYYGDQLRAAHAPASATRWAARATRSPTRSGAAEDGGTRAIDADRAGE